MSKEKNQTSKSNKIANILIVICLLIVAGCVAYIGFYFWNQKRQSDKYEQIASEAYAAGKGTEEDTASTEEKPQIPIDFETLQKKNPDIYAWIKIPGTVVDYPILQSATDDGYYLNHTVDGTNGLPGSIYTEQANTKDFSDFNTVIYGHHMKNRTMFGSLHKYRDEEFMKQNATIYIYTPDSILTYEVFAAVTYSDDHILNTFDFSRESGRKKYLDSIYSIRDMNSPIREDVPVDADSRIITLSTCIGGQPNNRLLVEAVLVDEQK
ncbi:MAG: class B sortase [Clostridiaceae bacterium]|nr:class B sortase [Clostridiaceae bacterium]